MNLLAHWYLAAMQHPGDMVWASVAFAGQGLFGLRFLIQWLSSEKEGHSVVPLAFWYFSIAGGAENAVWSYEHPYDEVLAIREHLAFYPNRVDAIKVEPAA